MLHVIAAVAPARHDVLYAQKRSFGTFCLEKNSVVESRNHARERKQIPAFPGFADYSRNITRQLLHFPKIKSRPTYLQAHERAFPERAWPGAPEPKAVRAFSRARAHSPFM